MSNTRWSVRAQNRLTEDGYYPPGEIYPAIQRALSGYPLTEREGDIYCRAIGLVGYPSDRVESRFDYLWWRERYVQTGDMLHLERMVSHVEDIVD